MLSNAEIQTALAELDQADPQIRLQAIQRLGEAQCHAAVPRLLVLLRTGAIIEQEAVATALGLIGDAEAVPALVEMLQRPELQGLRSFPAAIIKIGAPAVPYLLLLLTSDDQMVLAAAILILQEIDTPEAQQALADLPPQRRASTAIFGLNREEAKPDTLESDAKKKRERAEEVDELLDLDDEADEVVDRPFPPPPPQEFMSDRADQALPIPAPAAPIPKPAPDDRFGDEEPLTDILTLEPPAPQPAKPGSSTADGVTTGESAVTDQPLQFTAYYPKEVIPNDWQPLTAYVYKAMFAEQVAADAQKQLGILTSTMRRITEAARQFISDGTLITATPYLNGFQFNPPSITIGLYEDWHRLEFKLRAKDAPLNMAANGYLTFTVLGVIVADIPLSIFVGETTSPGPTASVTQKLYQAIFCSYSHKDMVIVERVERAYKALGMDFLRDVYTLKSGQDWDDQLLKLIEQADIFQLFWSRTAAESKYVRQEWEYALKLNRQQNSFIRPVYWEEPMPPVPPELGEIHFAFEPELDD